MKAQPKIYSLYARHFKISVTNMIQTLIGFMYTLIII
jgi:hypothetical protein